MCTFVWVCGQRYAGWLGAAWINKVLDDEEHPVEWVLWMDIDTVVIDANFTLPFEEFAAKSKDLVVYGNLTEVKEGHPVKGTPLPSFAACPRIQGRHALI
jgi:hypothetical protein